MGSPVGKEQAETNGLEDTGKGSHGHSVQRTLLGEDLGDELRMHGDISLDYLLSKIWRKRWVPYARSGASHEDQATQISCTLVAQRASSIDQSADSV